MKFAASHIKKFISSILVFIGQFHHNHGIPVLLYHSVDTSGSVISIQPSEFRIQMKYLKFNGYRTITLHEFIEHLSINRKSLSKTVVLTFDDGYKNNYSGYPQTENAHHQVTEPFNSHGSPPPFLHITIRIVAPFSLPVKWPLLPEIKNQPAGFSG